MEIGRLQYITNGASESEILNEVREVIDAGGDWIQLRIKDETLPFIEIAKRVKQLCADKATLIINDKVEIAREIDADGVHVGLDDMPVNEVREILGKEKIIGGTCNTVKDCEDRVRSGVDYIGLGPYKLTKTKKKLSPVLGLNGYQEIIPDEKQLGIPVVAIGGIELTDIAPLVQQTGLHGIAVSGLISRSADKKGLIDRIKEELGTGVKEV